jgi:molybdate transport system ATP-binding protein
LRRDPRFEKIKTKREFKLNEMIELMQLRGLEKLKPGQLSGGQQQRAALARILAGNPGLLMLDEPFSALDSHLREQLQVETKRLLKDFGKESFLVTHSRDEAYQMCDNIALIDSGKIIAYKETKQLFASPESRQAALLTGCKNVAGAKKTGDYSVYVPAWGAQFTTSEPVRSDLCAIGIRAHHFDPEAAQNRHPIHIMDETESPFEYKVQFRYENQLTESQNIWFSISKGKWAVPSTSPKGEVSRVRSPSTLGVAPDDIMLLYM